MRLRLWRGYLSILMAILLVLGNYAPIVQAEENTQSEQPLTVQTDEVVTTEENSNQQNVTESTFFGRLVRGTEPLSNITFSIQTTGNHVLWYDFTTDENGIFTYNLPDGEYKLAGIWVDPTWYALDKTVTVQDGFINGEGLFVIDVLPAQNPTPPPSIPVPNVVGTLLNGTEALAYIPFSIHTLDGKNWFDTVSNSQGKFSFTLPDGSYQIDGIWVDAEAKWYTLNQQFTVTSGHLVGLTELQVNVSPVSENNVSGILLKGSEALAHIPFSIQGLDSGIWYDASSDENGHFAFNLPDGSYQVAGIWLASESKWYSLKQQFQVANGKLSDSALLEINVTPPKKHNVTGILTNRTQTYPNVTFSIQATSGEGLWYDTQTDATGNYGFYLPNGSYKLAGIWVDTEGKWYDLQKEFTVDGELEFNIDLAPVTLPETNFTGKLTKGTEVIANTWISVHTTNGEVQWYDAQTDANGIFGFTLPNGTYQLDGVWVDSEQQWYPLQKVFTVDGSLSFDIDVLEIQTNTFGQLKKGQEVIPDTWLSVHTTSGEEKWYDAQTDAEGNFEFKLPDGLYQLDGIWLESEFKWYELNVQFTVENGRLVGSELLEINIDIHTLVTGVVKDANAPFVDATVAFYERQTRKDYFTKTDENGRFSMELPNGDYEVHYITTPEFSALTQLPFKALDGKVLVAGQEVTSLEVSLPTVAVTGKLVIPDMEINHGTVIVKKGTSDLFVAFTTNNGDFSLRLTDGSYQINEVYVNGKAYDVSINFEVVDGSAAPVSIDLTELVTPGNVTGIVQDQNGPVAGAEVLIENIDTEQWYLAESDATGLFSVNLPDGENYRVEEVRVNGDFFNPNLYFSVVNSKIMMDSQEVAALEIKVPESSFTGQVVEEDGTPVANAEIQIEGVNGYNGYSLYTSQTGQFSKKLPDGDYLITQVDSQPFEMPFTIQDNQLLLAGEPKDSLLLTLLPVSVTGKVVEKNGTPITYGYIGFNSGSNDDYLYWNVAINENGEFQVRIPDGTYHIDNVQIGGTMIRIDQTLELLNGVLKVDGVESSTVTITLPPVTVEGVVFDPEGNPLLNMSPFISIKEDISGPAKYFHTHADEKGTFKLRLADGQYIVNNVQVNGNMTVMNLEFSVVSGKLFIDGEAKNLLELHLLKPNLKGQILDENSVPLKEARINIMSTTTYNMVSATTNQNGQFELNLTDGPYRVSSININSQSVSQNYAFEMREGKLFVDGSEKNQLTIQLLPVTVRGSLLDSEGHPLTNASISFASADYRNHFSTGSDATGNFSLRLPDGDYVLTNIDKYPDSSWRGLNVAFSVVNGKLVVNGVNQDQLSVTLEKVYSVKGHLEENGLPVADAMVIWSKIGSAIGNVVSTNVNGDFNLSLGNGDYEILSIDFGNRNRLDINLAFKIEDGKLIVDGVENDILQVIVPSKNLMGQLVNENGTPIPNAEIGISESKINPKSMHTFTDENGFFKFRLADGPYKVFYAVVNGRSATLNIPFDMQDGKLVVNGVLQELLTVQLRAVTVQGVILNPQGNPLTDAPIYIYSTNGSGNYSTRTDSFGGFEFRIPDGNYRVSSVYDFPSQKSWSNVGNDFSVVNGKLVVNGVTKDSLTIELPEIFPINGLLVKNGQPIADAYVFYRKKGGNSSHGVKTNATGNFLHQLPNGEYEISFVELVNGTRIDVPVPFKVVDGKLYVNDVEQAQLLVTLPN
jgi:protocatechuate 3,4-dioxygenase beta subunit